MQNGKWATEIKPIFPLSATWFIHRTISSCGSVEKNGICVVISSKLEPPLNQFLCAGSSFLEKLNVNARQDIPKFLIANLLSMHFVILGIDWIWKYFSRHNFCSILIQRHRCAALTSRSQTSETWRWEQSGCSRSSNGWLFSNTEIQVYKPLKPFWLSLELIQGHKSASTFRLFLIFWGKVGTFFCPLLEKFCTLFNHFAQMGFILPRQSSFCPLSKSGQEKGCFVLGLGVFRV